MRSRALFVVLSCLVLALGPQASLAASVTLPAGTTVNVRTAQQVDADSAHVGMRLSGVIDDPIDAGGHVVIPRGSHAVLEVVGVDRSSNMKGRDRITLKLHSIAVGSHTYPVSTDRVEFRGPSEGKRARNKILGGAGIGAAVGGLLGGGTGAIVGGTTGGGAGAIIANSGKTHLSVPPETPVHFRLSGALRVE
jgi:hypothetical protein